MDPAVCEIVWLMIVGVRVCRLGEDQYVRGCVFMWVSGEVGYRDMFSAVIIYIMDYFLIQYVCFILSI